MIHFTEEINFGVRWVLRPQNKYCHCSLTFLTQNTRSHGEVMMTVMTVMLIIIYAFSLIKYSFLHAHLNMESIAFN